MHVVEALFAKKKVWIGRRMKTDEREEKEHGKSTYVCMCCEIGDHKLFKGFVCVCIFSF